MDIVNSLEDLLSEQAPLGTIEIPGVAVNTFGQATLSTTLPVSKLLSIYEVDLEVQRAIIPQNLTKLMDYIKLYVDGGQTIFFPGIIFSARGAGQLDFERGIYHLQSVEKLYVVDGQHRLAAFRRLAETLQSLMARARDRREYEQVEEITDKLKRLYNYPLSIMIYMDIDARQERQLFSDINKLPRKIGGNLALLRDQRRFYHVLATELAQSDPVLQEIGIDIFSERGKSPEYLFSYGLLVEVAGALFEGRLRSALRGNLYHFSIQDLNKQQAQVSEYFSKLKKYLPEPDKSELCWSETGQIAMALFFHEEAVKTGGFNPYWLDFAMKILPHIQWNDIFNGEEKDRLPRRSRIMKVYQYLRSFYDEHHAVLISEKEEAQ